MNVHSTFNPELDLRFERVVSVPVAWLWKGWTDPELLKKWFCPKPWQVTECRLDLRPGGGFWSTMLGPEPGQSLENEGCYLEVVPEQKLVWTSIMGAGYRPLPSTPDEFRFTAIVEFIPEGDLVRYIATNVHPDVANRERHEAMGFHEGWGKALDQLIALYAPATS